MQAVGKLGSYISKSVYTVSGPFHPFGGAVDIIVVEQPDGSYKSSPWYVRFGKFQGVLRTREKGVVDISVNGVDAGFHMSLDHKGEAFFMKEVEVEDEESRYSPPSSLGEDVDRRSESNASERNRNGAARTSSRRSQILAHAFGKEEEYTSGVVRTESLARAEIAADLLELKWSTNLAPSRCKKDYSSRFSAEDETKAVENNSLHGSGCNLDKPGVISCSSSKELESTIEENGVVLKCLDSKCVAETATSIECAQEDVYLTDELGSVKEGYHVNSVTIISEVAKCDSQIQESDEIPNSLPNTCFFEGQNITDPDTNPIYDCRKSERSGVELERSTGRENGYHGEVSVSSETAYSRTGSISDRKSAAERDVLHGLDPLSIQELGKGDQFTVVCEETLSLDGETLFVASESTVTDSCPHMSNCICVTKYGPSSRTLEDKQVFGNLDEIPSCGAEHCSDNDEKESNSSLILTVADGNNVSSISKSCSNFSLDHAVINDYINGDNLKERRLKTVSSSASINTSGYVQRKEVTQKNSIVKSSEDAKILKGSAERPAKTLNDLAGNPPRSISPLRGSQKDWPFSIRRSRSSEVSLPSLEGENFNAAEILEDMGDSEAGKDIPKAKNKKKVRTLTPTSEQLMSLELKEGKNIVVFTFSTSVLGKQQVDARIFLWRWDTKIVISDVDGTITRSDLLGQVMPLVGMDWSQIGVVHLFSAIKENGYQLLFLSARSISQAFHTRQFLFNIKQDGKALPDGPVIISPDGLFPSLFREVVRRVPHEFKIACLEDIKALFPADKNPFYAGFGNRDTDEFSYLKVGIPRGKIFIINPKGEIAVNRRVDTKSYLSLHALVHGMFPCMSSCEQEDFNSWNYWKLPPPAVEK